MTDKMVDTIAGRMTEQDVIRSLAGEIQHLSALLQWQTEMAVKLRKALKLIEREDVDNEGCLGTCALIARSALEEKSDG